MRSTSAPPGRAPAASRGAVLALAAAGAGPGGVGVVHTFVPAAPAAAAGTPAGAPGSSGLEREVWVALRKTFGDAVPQNLANQAAKLGAVPGQATLPPFTLAGASDALSSPRGTSGAKPATSPRKATSQSPGRNRGRANASPGRVAERAGSARSGSPRRGCPGSLASAAPAAIAAAAVAASSASGVAGGGAASSNNTPRRPPAGLSGSDAVFQRLFTDSKVRQNRGCARGKASPAPKQLSRERGGAAASNGSGGSLHVPAWNGPPARRPAAGKDTRDGAVTPAAPSQVQDSSRHTPRRAFSGGAGGAPKGPILRARSPGPGERERKAGPGRSPVDSRGTQDPYQQAGGPSYAMESNTASYMQQRRNADGSCNNLAVRAASCAAVAATLAQVDQQQQQQQATAAADDQLSALRWQAADAWGTADAADALLSGALSAGLSAGGFSAGGVSSGGVSSGGLSAGGCRSMTSMKLGTAWSDVSAIDAPDYGGPPRCPPAPPITPIRPETPVHSGEDKEAVRRDLSMMKRQLGLLLAGVDLLKQKVASVEASSAMNAEGAAGNPRPPSIPLETVAEPGEEPSTDDKVGDGFTSVFRKQEFRDTLPHGAIRKLTESFEGSTGHSMSLAPAGGGLAAEARLTFASKEVVNGMTQRLQDLQQQLQKEPGETFSPVAAPAPAAAAAVASARGGTLCATGRGGSCEAPPALAQAQRAHAHSGRGTGTPAWSLGVDLSDPDELPLPSSEEPCLLSSTGGSEEPCLLSSFIMRNADEAATATLASALSRHQTPCGMLRRPVEPPCRQVSPQPCERSLRKEGGAWDASQEQELEVRRHWVWPLREHCSRSNGASAITLADGPGACAPVGQGPAVRIFNPTPKDAPSPGRAVEVGAAIEEAATDTSTRWSVSSPPFGFATDGVSAIYAESPARQGC